MKKAEAKILAKHKKLGSLIPQLDAAQKEYDAVKDASDKKATTSAETKLKKVDGMAHAIKLDMAGEHGAHWSSCVSVETRLEDLGLVIKGPD